MEQGSDDIQALIALMARLPGLGPRSARRIVLQLVRRRSQQIASAAMGARTGCSEDGGATATSRPARAERCAPTAVRLAASTSGA